jgi:hypothetical protein
MSDATRMLLATPTHHGLDNAVLAEAIDAIATAGQAATACADACLDEYNLHRDCITACVTAADLADVTARLLSRTARWDRTVVHGLVDVCAKAMSTCAGQCEAHADTAKHCGVCADACRRAERAIQQLLVGFATLANGGTPAGT